MTAAAPSLSRSVLADAIPGGRVRDVTLVVGGAVFVGLVGNVLIPLGFTPVPLSLGTLAVLLVGASLGPWRAGLSMSLFLLAGVAGVPWFSSFNSGWAFSSFGYILGYIAAAILVGAAARRGADRGVLSTAALMVVGNLAIYAFGVPWLMAFLEVGFVEALALGVVPFLIGDAIKIVVAAGLLPSAWKLLGSQR